MRFVDFTKIKAWQKGHKYVLAVYEAVQLFPDFEKYGLSNQFTRAAVSITANISEGVQKVSKADKLRFLNISQGSLGECRNYNIIAFDLHYIDNDQFNKLNSMLNETSFFLNRYYEGIENDNGIKDNII